VRGALVCALVVLLSVACARPNNTVQVAPPTASPSPTPTTPVALTATAPFHGGEVGVAYAPVALSANGGVQPYTWSISAGALPNGLTLGPDGTVSGNPTTAGNFGFTVQVADSGDSTATMPGSIPIAADLAASLIPSCATQCSVELGCVSACGGFGHMSGGVGPYSFALTSGQLPSGTALSGLTLTGTFTGLSGYLRFSVQVTDSYGATATVAPLFWMYQHIALASGNCTGNFITGCSVRLPYSGGIGTPSVKLVSVGPNPNQGCWPPTATQPPAGYGLTVSGGGVVVSIPKGVGNGYGAVWTLQLTDQGVCAANTNCVAPLATVTIGVQCG
jgi:putative Ig domain-containing protein